MIRKLETQDFDMVNNWFYRQTSSPLAPACISEHGYLYSLTKPVACLYFFPVQGSKMAMIGWPVANPESSKEERDYAFPLLIKHIEDLARSEGYDWITTYASRTSVASRFHKAGYSIGDESVTQYLKHIKQGS